MDGDYSAAVVDVSFWNGMGLLSDEGWVGWWYIYLPFVLVLALAVLCY